MSNVATGKGVFLTTAQARATYTFGMSLANLVCVYLVSNPYTELGTQSRERPKIRAARSDDAPQEGAPQLPYSDLFRNCALN